MTSILKRSIVFDTETTGIDPLHGDRVIEIACLELDNDLPTGRQFHALIDPERDIPADATRVHGFTWSDLKGKPRFAEIADAFLEFIGPVDALIAHNAAFDFGFIDAELARVNLPSLDRTRMVDTYALARRRFPGMPNSLDALCRRFEIDLSERGTHNALLDCRLLADVYIELTGGRQRGLTLEVATKQATVAQYAPVGDRVPHPMQVTDMEAAAHERLLDRMKEPLWRS